MIGHACSATHSVVAESLGINNIGGFVKETSVTNRYFNYGDCAPSNMLTFVQGLLVVSKTAYHGQHHTESSPAS